jgi:hypothetical protein
MTTGSKNTRDAFIAVLTQTCERARLCGMPVEVVLDDGSTARGVPRLYAVGRDDPREADATGYSRRVSLGDEEVDVNDVRELRVRP